VQELRAAQMANIALEQRRASAVRRAYEEKVEAVAMFGESTVGLAGFFNNSTVDVIAANKWFDTVHCRRNAGTVELWR
jgi:hypothetical protein